MAKKADLQRPFRGGSRSDEVCWPVRSAVHYLSRPILYRLRCGMVSHCFRNAPSAILFLGAFSGTVGYGSRACPSTAQRAVVRESLSGRDALDGRANLREGDPH